MLRLFCPTLCISLTLLLALPATNLAARQHSTSSKGMPVVIEDDEKTRGLEAPSQASQLRFAASEKMPLPERNPSRNCIPKQAPLAPGEMATIPWSEAEIAEAKAKCSEALSSLSLDYKPLPPIKEGLCGAPAPILLKALGQEPEVALDPPAIVTCTLAKALSTWLNESVQPQAKASFNSSVTKLHVGSYSCRNRNGGADQPLSEHALANALDISDFILSSGERVAAVDSWSSDNPPMPVPNPDRTSSSAVSMQRVSVRLDAPKGVFLKSIHDDACRVFGTVLGPGADEAHKSHLHVDMKERRGGSFCQ
jgi:hypothetical protein